MMMMTFIPNGGESQGKTKKERKATKSKGRGLEEGASRALMRQHGEEGGRGHGQTCNRDNIYKVCPREKSKIKSD